MSHTPAMPLLLDTHVWIWLIEGTPDRLSRRAIDALESASAKDSLIVSAISLWEVAMISSRQRIRLSREIHQWLDAALNAPGVYLAPLTPSIAVLSTSLPGRPHRDPADLLLIATARDANATLVTCDKNILKYANATGALSVLDANP